MVCKNSVVYIVSFARRVEVGSVPGEQRETKASCQRGSCNYCCTVLRKYFYSAHFCERKCDLRRTIVYTATYCSYRKHRRSNLSLRSEFEDLLDRSTRRLTSSGFASRNKQNDWEGISEACSSVILWRHRGELVHVLDKEKSSTHRL